jgi:hypothetical protein
MILTEKQLLNRLDNSKKITLIQPNYITKYPPLGLAKIAGYKGIENCYFNYNKKSDLICITSLFTYYSENVFNSIEQALYNGYNGKIIIGGIFASLMPDTFTNKYKDSIDVFCGYSTILDYIKPEINYFNCKDKFKKYSFVFTTRGCPNSCAYCAVKKIEKERWLNTKWQQCIDTEKKILMVSDNNLSSWPKEHLIDIIEFSNTHKMKLVFDNGLDCKLIDEDTALILSCANFEQSGLRLAFDRIEEEKQFINAIKLLLKNKIAKKKIMAYVLFNFTDTLEEANFRMETCKKLGIRPYPQCFVPLNKLDKKDIYIGKYWNLDLIRKFRFFWLMRGYYTKYTFKEFYKR